jgi:hypothetical protein
MRRHLIAVPVCVAAVAAVTGLVFVLRPHAPVVSLGVLYLFAVLLAAVLFGIGWAVAVAVLSMVAFNFFFLPPVHTLALRDSENWVVLAVYLVTAVVVGGLATSSRRRAADAEQRAREAALAADVSALLLESDSVREQLRRIAASAARTLGASRGHIELGSVRRPDPDESAFELTAGKRHVGTLYLESSAQPDPAVLERVLPALGALLQAALDRERLARPKSCGVRRRSRPRHSAAATR